MIPPLFEYAGGGVDCRPAELTRRGRRKRQNHRLRTIRITTTGTTMPIVIWALTGRPPLVMVFGRGVAVDVGVVVDLVDVSALSVGDDVVETVGCTEEVDVLVRNVVDGVDEDVDVDDVPNKPLTQYGSAESPPTQVWPLAQQMVPHLKSPTAQTRAHPC
jgi:hypothetical protein